MLFFNRNKSKNVDVTHITKALYAAERAQDKANNDLENATDLRDMIKDQITQVTVSHPSSVPHSRVPTRTFSVPGFFLFLLRPRISSPCRRGRSRESF